MVSLPNTRSLLQLILLSLFMISTKWGHLEKWSIPHFFTASKPCLYNGIPAHFADSPQLESVYKMLSVTQPPPSPETLAKLYRPASVVDKAHIHSRYDKPFRKQYSLGLQQWSGSQSLETCKNVCFYSLRWLDSSRCLLQQGIQENDKVWLRFKYFAFYEIDPKVCMCVWGVCGASLIVCVLLTVCLCLCSTMLCVWHRCTSRRAGPSCWKTSTAPRRRWCCSERCR